MTSSQTTIINRLDLLAGLFTLLLGGTVLFGWWFDYPLLTRINPEWVAMAPSTALCFMLSGLSLLTSKRSQLEPARDAQRIFVWLILLLAGSRAVEFATGHTFSIEYLLPSLGSRFENVGHMTPQAMAGFLFFGSGMLSILRAHDRKVQLYPGSMAAALLTIGLITIIGYWLKFQFVFEDLYLKTNAIWMAFHTAIGMFVLGLGLTCLSLRCRLSSNSDPIAQKSSQIYRTTLLVLAATAAASGLAGISFLEGVVFSQANNNLAHTLEAIRSHIDSSIESRIQRALVSGLNPAFRDAAAHLGKAASKSARAQQAQISEGLQSHGFTGIALERGKQRQMIAGHPLPDTTTYTRLNGAADAALAWSKGYYLRVRVPLSDMPGEFLVFEQALTQLDKTIGDTNHWGETGSLPMCARLDEHRLLCFPQREQAAMYVVPDQFEGKPIPMNYALADKSGIDSLTDYRGHRVLAAYGPIGNTGLGLVLRMDLAEIYAPVRDELLIVLPFITVLVVLGLMIIRSRVRPLIANITSAYDAENTAKERFDAAMQSSPDGFVIYSAVKNPAGNIVDFRCEYLNHQAETMAKFAAENLPKNPKGNLVGRTFLEIFPDRADMFHSFRMVALTGQLQVEELSLPGKDGSNLWYLRQVVPMHQGIAVTYRNITQEKLLIQQLQLSTQLRTAIVEGAAYAIISTDVDGTIRTFNQAAERMLWYRADELIGKATPGIFHDPEEITSRAVTLSQELGHKVEPGFEVFVAKPKIDFQEDREWTYVRKDGSRFPVRLSVTALRDEKNALQGFLGIANDISEQKRADEYIRHIALHDVLTGLPNRALLDDRVMSAIEQQRRNNTPFALAMMDIDRFKHINDTMGHHIGDMILKVFVERVKSCLRPTDTLARMGGDEFVLLLAESEESGAKIVVERIRHAMIPPINVKVQEVHITSSIGISISPRDGNDINELMRRADVAMYWVKEHGRNGYKVFSLEMDSGGVERLNLERDLHLALENGGFSLFYQPVLDLKSNTITGVEALIRMRKGNGQYVSPADFIPLAEDLGLIVPIGKWVLETACEDVIRLQKLLGASLKVAVNISPREFVNGGLVSQVQEVLRKANLDAGLLELEITEGVLMDERNGVSVSLSELHALGVKIAIDDFGTGYSSLSYLKRFPISTLKIDQSFVRDLTSDPGDAHLITAIIAMGHHLGIPVVAEGIETAEQLAFLAANNCDHGQGFFIGHPMPFDALLQWFDSDTRWKLIGKSTTR